MKSRGKAPEAAPLDVVPEGHPSDQELFDVECDGPSPAPPVSPMYIRARRRIYNLGREHGRAEAPALTRERFAWALEAMRALAEDNRTVRSLTLEDVRVVLLAAGFVELREGEPW